MSSMPPPPPPPGGPPATPPGYQQYPVQSGAYAAAVPARQRTGWLVLAQILSILQGIVFLLGAVGFALLAAVGGSALNNLINNLKANGTDVNAANTITGAFLGVTIGVAVVLAILALLMIVFGIRAGRPSLAARLVVSILVIIFVLLSLLSIANAFNSMNSTIAIIVFWVWEALILFGMLIHGTRRRDVVVAGRP